MLNYFTVLRSRLLSLSLDSYTLIIHYTCICVFPINHNQKQKIKTKYQAVHYYSDSLDLYKKSALTDKPCNAFVQMHWNG